MSKLLLVDGHAILHRAFHALPPLTNNSNQPTGAIYGFLSILIRTIHKLKPTHLAVTFDRKEPTFRKKLLTTYQAHRPVIDESLVSQIISLHEILEKMGIASFEMSGYEADDIIGTLVSQVQDKEVVIITGDRDILQLVSDNIKVLMPVKGLSEARLFGNSEVKEKMGVNPAQITDLKALTGDPSDNYFGVSGIGPKTAINLIETYGSISEIYENIDKITGKVKEKLIQGKKDAFMSKTLATIIQDVPVKLEWEKLKLANLDNPGVRQLFKEWGFVTLITRLSGDMIESKNSNKITRKPKINNSNAEQTSLF